MTLGQRTLGTDSHVSRSRRLVLAPGAAPRVKFIWLKLKPCKQQRLKILYSSHKREEHSLELAISLPWQCLSWQGVFCIIWITRLHLQVCHMVQSSSWSAGCLIPGGLSKEEKEERQEGDTLPPSKVHWLQGVFLEIPPYILPSQWLAFSLGLQLAAEGEWAKSSVPWPQDFCNQMEAL